MVYRAPNLAQVCQHVVALIVGEGDDAVEGRMVFEEWGEVRVEHQVDMRLGKGGMQGVEQRRGQDGIAQLPESDYKYIHCV